MKSLAKGGGFRMPYRQALPLEGQGEDAGSYNEDLVREDFGYTLSGKISVLA